MTANQQFRRSPAASSRTWSLVASLGSVVSAFAASICCIGPLLFAVLGIGGAGLLVSLEAFRPYFIALTVALLGSGFYVVYRGPKIGSSNADSRDDCACHVPRVNQVGKIILWVTTAIAAVFLSFPYLASHLFN